MKRCIIAAVVLSLFSIDAFAALSRIDGHEWNACQNSKQQSILFVNYMLSFLEGVDEGARLSRMLDVTNAVVNTDDDPNSRGRSIQGMLLEVFKFSGRYKLDDIIPMVTEFYADSANLDITIYGAMQYISSRVKGLSRDQLDVVIQRLRREAAQQRELRNTKEHTRQDN